MSAVPQEGLAPPPAGPAPDLSVVVVTYNAPEWTRRGLAAIPAGARTRSLELVVVDNASTALDPDALREWAGPDAVVRLLPENIGFGRACNAAVELSRGRNVVLVNPDALLEPGCLDALLDFLERDPSRGIVGGRVSAPSGELDRTSCLGRQSTWSLVCFATGLSTLAPRSALLNPEGLGPWARDTVREVGVVTGCLLLTSRETWDELGGFDPRFFMYGEDADLCRRAWEAGYRPSFTPDARAVHALGASSSSRVAQQVLIFRGKATLVGDAGGRPTVLVQRALLLAGVALRAAGERVTGRDRSGWLGLWRRRPEWSAGW